VDNNNDLVIASLLDIKQDIGALNSKVEAYSASFTEHLKSDEKVSDRVTELEGTVSRAKWSLAAVAVVCTILFKGVELFFTRTH